MPKILGQQLVDGGVISLKSLGNGQIFNVGHRPFSKPARGSAIRWNQPDFSNPIAGSVSD